jgi:hypothetical protein
VAEADAPVRPRPRAEVAAEVERLEAAYTREVVLALGRAGGAAATG